jgi:hypothetical protein
MFLEKSEIKNILYRSINPFFLIRLIIFLIGRTIQRLFLKYLNPYYFYPSKVKKELRSLKNVKYLLAKQTPKRIQFGYEEKTILKISPGKIEFQGEPDWNITFKDIETTFSLHRWNWLFYTFSSNSKIMSFEKGILLMRSWINHKINDKSGVEWVPYTTGERISNACLYFLLNNNNKNDSLPLHNIPDDIRDALIMMAFHLSDRIEYKGEVDTNNHIICNARALYFAGVTLGIKEFSKLSFVIIKNSLSIFLTEDGFLREGSSHYHFLFTRWILEMYWLSKYKNDLPMENLLKPFAKVLTNKCDFFLIKNKKTNKWQIPLFGDISPDCSPDWLIGIPWSIIALNISSEKNIREIEENNNTNGWQNLWGPTENVYRNRKKGEEQFFQNLHKSYWSRCDYENFTLFMHYEPKNNSTRFASHRHSDLASFMLYHKGIPLIIDTGRFSYDNQDQLGQYGISPMNHNSVTIDGLGPQAGARTLSLPLFYSSCDVAISKTHIDNQIIIELTHNGFNRLVGDNVKHIRRFGIGYNCFWLEDIITGNKSHQINTYFHLSSGIDILSLDDCKNSFSFNETSGLFRGILKVIDKGKPISNLEKTVYNGILSPNPAGWYSTEYGIMNKTNTIIYNETSFLPYHKRFQLEINDLCVE